jgi:phosphoribosyl-ATP pyrophosphohydrolase
VSRVERACPAIRPKGIVTERKTMAAPENTLAQLMAVIEDRRANPPAKSYTTTLFAGGVPKIGDKIREEAGEVVEAAAEPDEAGRQHLIRESADLIYHLFVMMAHRGVSLSDVEAELARRAGISGLDEKASRKG